MSILIFLNGAGSSGKTSIARAIQHLSDKPWLTFGIDTFIEMTPYPTADKNKGDYLVFTSGTNKFGPTTRVEATEKGAKLFQCMAAFTALVLNAGHNLILDEVLLSDEQLSQYLSNLSPDHTVYFVGVYCDLETMQEREILRRDRTIGLSNDQFSRVHKGLREYDFTVDTSNCSTFEAAKKILEYVSMNLTPQGFLNTRQIISHDKT